jgi:hypothetical protein
VLDGSMPSWDTWDRFKINTSWTPHGIETVQRRKPASQKISKEIWEKCLSAVTSLQVFFLRLDLESFNTCILLFCSLLCFALYMCLCVCIISVSFLGGDIVKGRQIVFFIIP